MIIKYQALTMQGQGRTNNEDCYSVLPDDGLFMVSDGMGGHNAGEVASNIAINAVAYYLRQNAGHKPADILLEEAVSYANEQILTDSRKSDGHQNMGATLAAVWQQDDLLYVAHVGDSRVYVFNDEQARSLTRDHSLVGDLLREGVITAQQAINHPQKNVLTRALGVEEQVLPDISVFEQPIPGFLLICSDGLSAYLPMEKVLPHIAARVKPEQMLPVLAELAKEAGSNDDITGVLLWQTEDTEEVSGND
ncbi:MAG: serine/threonine-protein phosphatase [Firmicutes bacterium]|nr:serine/threonine-protein phosphatase [Bacillota bacterium]